MAESRVMLITGSSRGLGRALSEHYLQRGWTVVGASRSDATLEHPAYTHHALDVGDEPAVLGLFREIQDRHGRLDALLNNAGIASMNHSLLTPMSTVERVIHTNYVASFLFCREAAKLMQKRSYGRIVNFTTVAVRLKLAGEAAYTASKAAIGSLTEVLAHEYGRWGITVNAVGPTPIATDLIKGVPQEKIDALVARQAIPRRGEVRDVVHAVDFFVDPASDFISGQILYLGGL